MKFSIFVKNEGQNIDAKKIFVTWYQGDDIVDVSQDFYEEDAALHTAEEVLKKYNYTKFVIKDSKYHQKVRDYINKRGPKPF